MPSSKHSVPRATLFIKRLRGGSQPVLVQADDGGLYVAKFINNPQGANLAFNESMGTELYRACSLNVPPWKPLLLSDAFIDRNPACWIQTEEGLLRPSSGLCFGSHYLAADMQIFEILPQSSFDRVNNRSCFWLAWLIDICAEHADNRQALFIKGKSGRFFVDFIDMGHLFGGPDGRRHSHFIASRYLDPRVYPSLSSEHRLRWPAALGNIDADALRRRAIALPEEWKTASALQAVERCLHRFSNRALIESLLDTIADSAARRIRSERFAPCYGCKPAVAVLRRRVQTAAFAQKNRGGRLCSLACDHG